jgi:hypothetical protein
MREYRAGDTIEDLCRACKIDRLHTVIAADAGRPLRVQCDYCGSQHGYRGGASEGRVASARATPGGAPSPPVTVVDRDRAPFPLVSDRERVAGATAMDTSTTVADLELLIRRIIREEGGLSPVVPAERWRGGTLALRPGNPALQEKAWPIETFFHKVVMIRNRLRTLEQQLNASDLPDDQKIKLQTYITGCYGSLTSFNVLFADEDDRFRGSGGDD